MKIFNYTKRILPLMIIAFLFGSCEEDFGGILEQESGPSAGLNFEEGFVNTVANVETGETFKVKLSANSGSTNLKSVSIKEDGFLVDFARISINGSDASANPILLFTPDTEGFTWEIEVEAHTDEASRAYTFEVADEGNQISSNTVTITTMDVMPIAPSLEYLGSSSFTATPGSFISIPLNVLAGNKPLSHIAVAEGAEFIEDLSRLYFGDTQTNFTSNPHPLSAEDQNGFEKNIFIKASTEAGTKSYRVFVVDGVSDGAFVDFEITTGSSVDLIEGILFNAAGVAGTGGLDLDDGIGLGSRDPEAEIKDEGIDLNQPLADNWRQRVSGVNGSEIKYVQAGVNGVPEGFSFDNVTLKEELPGLFNSGMRFDLLNGDDESISYRLSEGDVLIVRNAGRHYLLKIREINIVTNGNADHYVLDVKK